MYDLKEKNTLADEVEKKLNSTKRKQQMRAYDNKLDELADTIERMSEKHGQDYFMVEILTMFLDVSIKMKEVMEMMNSMNMVMELFGDAVGFIDQSMQLQSDIMQDTAAVKYNFWTKITSHFRNRMIIRNNINRLNAMSKNILVKYQMANDMVGALQGVSGKLKKMTQKISKKGAVSGGSGGGTAQYTDANKYLAERQAAKGGTVTATTYSGGNTTSNSGPSSSGGLDLSGI